MVFFPRDSQDEVHLEGKRIIMNLVDSCFFTTGLVEETHRCEVKVASIVRAVRSQGVADLIEHSKRFSAVIVEISALSL